MSPSLLPISAPHLPFEHVMEGGQSYKQKENKQTKYRFDNDKNIKKQNHDNKIFVPLYRTIQSHANEDTRKIFLTTVQFANLYLDLLLFFQKRIPWCLYGHCLMAIEIRLLICNNKYTKLFVDYYQV